MNVNLYQEALQGVKPHASTGAPYSDTGKTPPSYQPAPFIRGTGTPKPLLSACSLRVVLERQSLPTVLLLMIILERPSLCPYQPAPYGVPDGKAPSYQPAPYGGTGAAKLLTNLPLWGYRNGKSFLINLFLMMGDRNDKASYQPCFLLIIRNGSLLTSCFYGGPSTTKPSHELILIHRVKQIRVAQVEVSRVVELGADVAVDKSEWISRSQAL